MVNKLLKNIAFLSISVSLVVFLIIYMFTDIFFNLDRSISDRLHQGLITWWLPVSEEIVVLGIDDVTLEKLWRFPFSRDTYIPVIENLNKDWATVIAFDIMFVDESDEEIDIQFASAIKKSKNVILGGPVDKRNWRFIYEEPIKILNEVSYWRGYYSTVQNSENQKVYSVQASRKIQGDVINHFSIEILKAYYSKLYWRNDFMNKFDSDRDFFYITPPRKLSILKESRKLPFLDLETKEVAINYVHDWRIAYQSFSNVYSNNFEKGFFKDKIVIIWATAQWIKDVFFTPQWIQYWVYTHANLINTELTKKYKIYFDEKAELFLIFFLIILSVYFNLSQSWKLLAISNIAVISIFIVIVSVIIIGLNYTLNYPAQFAFALIITLTVSNIIKSFTEDKNKAKLSKALWEYVSKDIAREILHWGGELNLDGQRKDLSIFFSDIKWFTTISEKLDPEELVAFLREYLGAMSNVIMDRRWFIDKYEWDAIMAMWWVFGFSDTSTYDNCISALAQQKKLAELNIWWKERFWEALKVRMGIHTWEAIVWNIWATGRKMEFTALWDSVNLASRLEWVNKLYWTYICVSEDVFNTQNEVFEFRYLDKIRVQWKTIPIGIYELFCEKGELSEEIKRVVLDFNGGIVLYSERKFEEAFTIFEKLSKNWDAPSTTYMNRCTLYINNPPEADWDGVWNMQTK